MCVKYIPPCVPVSSELYLTDYSHFTFFHLMFQPSESTLVPIPKDILDELGGYKLEFRGEVELKVYSIFTSDFV